jgi:hypothetical protein
MVLSVAVIVQQQLNGRCVRGESPAAFFIAGICPLLLVGSIPKQGAAGIAALRLGAFPSDSEICMKSAIVAASGYVNKMSLLRASRAHV